MPLANKTPAIVKQAKPKVETSDYCKVQFRGTVNFSKEEMPKEKVIYTYIISVLEKSGYKSSIIIKKWKDDKDIGLFDKESIISGEGVVKTDSFKKPDGTWKNDTYILATKIEEVI